ncbi:Os08g0471100 [Oryza sativa Japonica Group]|uniref:Os08g0471100 protein n=1 Tax=Oryza sativa subsp. japonica TaxID=39947 RepID=C7J5U1_ORYSJ|nr:Os08g0471100 [Oryza sativa Japonica Group]|eukprot:NP_001175620.1 Os08g0471100 [Oryza sativa Japonica Group]
MMDRLVQLHYGGCVVDESTHGSQFEGMTVRQLVFFAKPTFEELMSRIKHELDWNDESVGMQGRYDVGGGVMSHKFMLDLNGEIEWQTYIDIVLGSHFKSLEVFAWKKDGRIGKKELIESPISCHELSERCSRKEELIEEDVEGGEGVNDMADVEVREENDPVREEVHAEENVPLREEVHAEDNVPLREEVNVEENVPVREEGDVEDGREVGDDVELPEEEANAKNVSMGLRELARLKFYTREECEEAMIRSGLNPGWLEYDTEDELDESASDSDDDRPVRKMSEHERTVFAKLVGRNPEITQFEDLTRSGLAIADGDPQYDGAFEPMCDEPRKGLEFRSMDDLKIWLQSYSIRVHRPYHVKESNASVKYLAWLHRTYRLVLRPAWTLADIADDPEDVEEQNEYDTRTRLGTTVETGPVRDRVARELLQTVNDAGVALGTAPGSEGEGGTLRNALQRLRQRCRKLAARLGCRSTDVVEHAHAHQEGDEEGEVGDEEGEQDKEAEEGDEEEEGDEDREEEADELGPSQLEDAPESSQPDISQPGPSRPRRRRAPSQDWRYTPDVPRPRTRAPVHLALRSQPSHPEGLLGWATAETAKSHLSARWAGAEFPTVSAIMAGAEVPARKPSIRLAGLGLGGCGQVPPQRQVGWR